MIHLKTIHFIKLTDIHYDRCQKEKAERDLKFNYEFGPGLQTTDFTRPEQTNRTQFPDMFPNTFSYLAPDESDDSPVNDQGDNEHLYDTIEVPQRISTISGKSVDIGDLSGISEFVVNPTVVPAGKRESYGAYLKRNADSMRSSAGVDLGGDYYKAWRIVGNDQSFHL
ncbi:uncharacterized protein LOC123557545 isoform X3 [Mercenaria mercenaria]|uniref:uncharacterized protein LOC123557545 isoform X3 n=1 Tax=Mercenaria mercenaria TaxID=6596 RepID=UPI00234EBF39|nr:uncharacterized protein LOC123557545 isoform X3 [Mercenaria mercenaria]